MTRLLETIQVKEGEVLNLDRHVARMNKSRLALCNCRSELEPATVVGGLDLPGAGIWKLRIVYGIEIASRELTRYIARPVGSLKLVHDDTIEYSHKYADRSALEALDARRGSCDSVLIAKNDAITDTVYANIALYDGSEWYTPSTPLLAGIQRAALIAEGKLQERHIRVEDLARYQSFVLINAMLGWGESEPTDIAAIVS